MALFPDDEECVSQAEDTMLSMCGNAGQESIIMSALSDFEETAIAMLEEEGALQDWAGFSAIIIESIGYEKFDATDEIWEEAYNMIVAQSDFHDSNDEMGEGTGDSAGGAAAGGGGGDSGGGDE